ncbi:disulfide bond formation protein B [Candidatus Woesebacteria bacterium]|nr:disulfide bond formation protein B [Candidatus Woesebacteria bacterium]
MWLISYLSFLTLVSNIVFIFSIVFWKKIVRKIAPYTLELALIISIASTVGSLYMSNVVFLAPCELCWFQRIFMYPLVIIFLVARVRKIPRIWELALPFSIFGALIAGYHYILQLFPKVSETCGPPAGGFGSCTDIPFKDFGFITIPWMSLTAFVFITVSMLIRRRVELTKADNRKS